MNALRPEDRIRQVLTRTDYGAQVTMFGWVRTRRDSKGGFSFIELNDGSCLKGIQVVADQELDNYESDVLHLATGSSLRVQGVLKESPGKGQSVEVQASRIEVLGGVEAAGKHTGLLGHFEHDLVVVSGALSDAVS